MQNTSYAVMAQRVEPHDSLDDFPTPPWAVRSFCEWLDPDRTASVWEPAANRGYMVHALSDYFGTVYASDVHDYGAGFEVYDFLMPGSPPYSPQWVITNPPFRLAGEFVKRGLEVADGVAVIVRSVWAESQTRYHSIFNKTPPNWILQHVNRVPMVKGRYDPAASTATGYSWFVWSSDLWGTGETRFGWLPYSRADLFCESDAIMASDWEN